MYTKKQLLEDMEQLNINKNGTLLIHSSMKSIGEVEGGADTVLDIFCEYMKDGLLTLPTHTWSYIKEENTEFSVTDSKVCVGILPELFRKRDGVVRSWHPTHSVAAIGKDSKEFVGDDHRYTTPCARGSAWGKLLDRNATIMLLGVDLRRNTYMHGVEEWLDVEGRLTEGREQLYVTTEDGERILVPQHRHHGQRWSEHFWKVEDVFLEFSAMRIAKFGDATVRLVDARKVYDILEQMIKTNPDLFSDNSDLDRSLYEIKI